MSAYDRRAELPRLSTILREWTTDNPGWAYSTNSMTWALQLRAAVEIARDLLDATELAEVRFAGFMGEPDGQLIEAAVKQALPYPYGTEFQLLVDAVKIAADAKQKGEQTRAGLATAAVLLIGLLVIAGRS